MLQNDPWWWSAVAIALGFARWIAAALVWVALMASLYGIYVWFGGKAVVVCVAVGLAVLVHFHVRDIEDGMDGPFLQNQLVRWLRYRQRRKNQG